MKSTRAFGNAENRSVKTDGSAETGSNRQPISLLAFLEKENRELRKAVIDLVLDTHLLKTAHRRDKR